MTAKRVKIYELRVVALNSRTGAQEKREVSCNGNGRLTQRGLESLLTWGANLYAKGWDTIEFSVASDVVASRESFINVRKS